MLFQPDACIISHWSEQVMLDYLSIPEVGKCLSTMSAGPVLATVPVTTRKNVYLHPWQFDLTNAAKYGHGGKWPGNYQVKMHFPSVVENGYQAEKEAIEVKWPADLHGQDIPLFSTQYIDGHCKGVMVQLVFALLDHMEPRLSLMTPGLSKVLFLHQLSWKQNTQ